MGKVCVRCGREATKQVFEGGGLESGVICWCCPHCGPNVPVRDTEKVEMQDDEAMMVRVRMGAVRDLEMKVAALEAAGGMSGKVAAQMEARIEDLRDTINGQAVVLDGQAKLIHGLLGRPEQVPTRDDLVEALATARARLAAQDREKLELRNLAATLQEQVEFLSEEARSLHGVIRKLIEKLPDEVLRSVPDQPQTLEPMVATQPPSAPDEDQP
jgi:hypothetical protein